MKEFKVKLTTLRDVREFIAAAEMQRYEIEIVSGRYTIDAKSIMGLVSLDLQEPLLVQYCGPDDMADQFMAQVSCHVVA